MSKTSGIDENDCPVIIEYKRDVKDNVINQGLFYLDWLMEHKGDYELCCWEKLGKKQEVDWSNPRLLCIARSFTKWDDHAIKQIDRNIELIGYRVFEDRYILFEQESSVMQQHKPVRRDEEGQEPPVASVTSARVRKNTMEDMMKSAPANIIRLFKEIEEYILALGDDIQKRELKFYHAYARIRTFASLRVQKKNILLYVEVVYTAIKDPPPFAKDVSKIGKLGHGNTKIALSSVEELERVKPIIEQSYNA